MYRHPSMYGHADIIFVTLPYMEFVVTLTFMLFIICIIYFLAVEKEYTYIIL